ncbi:LPD38 domain-containing protein [Alistipes putredinis]|uniref:LPD38 domain-containing protein n=1 Tax=Alistipes putredinis TaxID=28117 RepID=UPI003AF488BA
MSLTERIYGKETAGKPAVSSDTRKNLYTAAANKKPSLANRIAQNGGQPTLYADAAAKQKPSLASRIEANGGTPYADAAAQMKSGNAAKGTSVVFNSVYGKADDRASSAGSGKYADILKASDYTELSKSGESKRKLFGDARYDYINNIGNFRAQSDVQQAQGRGQDYGKYAFMTDDEIGVYNYLYATQGKKAANAYLSDLEPELDKQWYTGTNRATTEALGKNAATRTLASAMTVAAQPARTITSMIAMADDAVRTAKGQEINPYSKWRQASNITQELRADTSQHIEETNPGMGGKVGSFVYNTAMSAADSAMNALVAKGIGEAVGLTGDTLMKATNILGSALMSSEAASLSIAESKEKGYSNAGALALGLTRGAIEYASEAVGGEWVIRKIKANPLSFVKSMALTMIPEGMEEVMSDAANGVVNLAIDAAFGTEESGIPKMLEYYRTSGTDWQKKHAELATVLAVLGQEGLSFLGGALATLGSSSVQYSTNRANINQTAERLDTTPKNVVQMMQDAQTENPGVIYALAELTDAENADDLRQKIGTKEDMKRAAEYLTQQMEEGGRFGTQEGVYTAGAQNAPVGTQRAQNEGISTTPTAAINIQEGMNNGQSTYQGRENGSYDLRTGGQAAAEGGAQALAGGRAEIPGGVGADAQADLRKVTPAQLGIRNGGTEAVTVVDAQKIGGDAARAYNLLAANNIEPVAVRGAIQVNNGYANAYTESGRVFFRVDAVDSRGNAISPEALVRHELFHNYISEEVLQASDEVIRESMTAEEYDAMYESYRDAYASIYDFENMSEDEIERLLTEEIAADAYAGLNWFSGDAPVQEAVRAETERNAPARRAEAQQKTTGPPGRATAAGIGAKTADSAALRRAEALEKSGTDNETIRQETGWYRGMDGQWRFEIDDSGAAFSRSGEAQYSADNADYARYAQLMNRMLTGELTEAEHAELLGLDKKNGSTKKELARRIDEGNATLRDIMQHNALFEAYPEIAETKVKFADMPSGTAGSYNRETNTITLDTKLKYDANEAIDALMHEVQHRVQAAEGFASGTNPSYWNRGENYDRAAEKYRDNRARLLNGLSTEDLALYNEYRSAEREMGAMFDGSVLYDESRMDALEKRSDELYRELYGKAWFGKLNRYDRILGDAGEAVKKFYRNTAGEIEARDTTSRRRMSAEERKNTPPKLGDADTVFADGSGASMAYVSNDAARFNPEGKTQDELLHDIMDSAEPFDQRYLYFGRFTDSFRTAMEKAGVEVKNLPVIMSYRDAYLAMESRENGRYQGQDINYHNLGIEGMKSAMENIGKPDAVMKSKRDGKIELFLDFVDYKGNRGLAIVQLDSNAQHAQEFIRANIVTSIYGKRRGDAYLEKAKSEGRLVYSKEEGPAQGITQVQYESNINAKPSSTATIRQTEGNSQEKSSGKASVEVSGINNRTAAELRREYDRRTREYQRATQRDDQSFPYIDEMKWMQAAERRLAELGDGKRKRRTVGNTKRDIMQLFFTDTANRADVEQMLNRNIGEMMAQGEIREDALDTIVDEMLQAGSVVSNSENSPWIDETHEEIRSDLRGTKLYVSEQTWRDFRKDEARTLREQAREAGITLSKNQNDTAADVRNMELAEKYGEALFPTDISAPDMLRNIVDRAAKGVSEKQTLADRLWDEARLEGAGRDQQEAYDRMVGALRDQTEVILREFAEDNHLTLREQTKQGSGSETGTKSEAEQRRERLQTLAEQDRREMERLRARENLGAGQRFVPNKSSGEVYRDLMGKGKSEVKVQMTGFLKGTPKESTFKVEVKPTPIGGYYEATIFHDGHKADTLVRALKETAARDAAEEVITMANRNFSEENYQRAKKFEAEKTADEDARIAELFGDPEQLDSTETSPKSSDAAETENTAAGATIDATTEKVTSEVIKAERNYREDFEKITSGAMRMFVNAGDTVRRIAKATGSKSLEGYYFNAGAYSQRAGNWIAKGGARTDIDGHRIGASLADTLAPMRKNETKYRDFQLYLLHMHNVDRMKYDNSGELERIKENLRWVKEKYPELRELSNEELRRIANSDSDSPVVRQAAHEIYLAAHNGEAPSLTSVAEGAAYALELERQRAIVEKQGLKPVFGYDVTADDSQTAAQLLEAKNPEFKEWAKEVYKYSDDLIRYRVEAGLITPEFANALKKRYPHYIPTFREEGTNSKRARSARRNGGIVVSNAIGRAVGSDGVLLPLHTALSRKTVSTMRNAGLNQFGLALVREYDRNAKAAEKYIWNVAESEYTPTEAAIESDEDYKPVFENVFSVKDNGRAYDITMDEGLTAAMKAFEPDKFANYGTAKAMKKLNDLFKALCTGYNPFFMIRNGVRDWQDAGFYSTDWKTWEKMYWSAWNQIRKNGEIWQQYKALGGSYASMLDYTTGMVKEPKNALGKAAARYESFGQAIEAAPRLAEFMTILANKGGSKTVDGVKTGKFTQSDLMEAMLGAADITTNFARGGSVTKALNRYLVPFLNPSVQGFDKFIRNATDIVQRRDVKAAASLILKAALINLPPLLLNGLMHGDDDEWDDIPANTKANYYLIKIGNGYWIKIPKGRAIAVLSTAAVYTQEKQKGEDVKFSDVFEVIKSNIAPTDIFNQNIATAWTQAKLTNPDNPGTTWYGGNIESDRLQNYRPEDRYDEKTDELSKAIGKLFKVSPKKVNYLLDQYTGVIGDILLPLMTPATSAKSKLLAAPMAAFTIDTTSTNKTTGEYYDLLDELKYDANDGDIGAGITRKYVSHAGDEVNDYYQQIRAIQNDKSLSDGEKNRLVRALKAQLIERQKEIIAQAEPYREAVSDYLKAHPELSTDNDAAIAEYAEQYEITEDQAESRMDAIVYREANREVFGAEYALRTYNADVYDKARTAYAKGVSYDTYYDYYFATKEMHADKDENGKSISGSKKAKVVEYINSLNIPPEQKDALYVAAGYTAKSAKNQKWNGGSGASGGRRGRGKRTAIKAPTPKAPEIIIPRSGTASSAKAGGTSKTPKVSGNVIADFTKTASGTDIQKAVTQAKRKALKAGNRTVYVEEGSPIDYFLKYGKLPSLK